MAFILSLLDVKSRLIKTIAPNLFFGKLFLKYHFFHLLKFITNGSIGCRKVAYLKILNK